MDIPFEERSIDRFLRQQAAAIPERPFVTIAGRSLGFGEADHATRAVARGFRTRGIGEGGRVMLMLPNCLEFMLAWFAAALRGAASVPINPELKGMLLEAILADARPDAVVVHAGAVEALLAVAPSLVPRHVFVVGPMHPAAANVVSFDSILEYGGPDPAVADDFRRIQSILYTSGTTGPSKGALIPNAAAFCFPQNYIKANGMTAADSVFSPLPMFHAMSTSHGIMPSLVLGAHVTIDERFSASRYWERAAECGATIGNVVHALVALLKVQPARASDRAHRLSRIFNARHDEAFEERFGVRTVEAYALTETAHVLHTPYPERRLGSTGRVNPDWEVRLVDDKDRPVPVGEPGELVCRPRHPYMMMQGYLNKPDITLESFRNLWYHTGDVLKQDADGYFYYLDRKKERIRRRGENISSAEVEVSVVAHPEVAECAAMPYPAGDGEDDVRVVVVRAPGSMLAAAELHAWLRERMPRHMVPRYIEFVEALPRTGTGKPEKHKLLAAGLGPGTWDAQR